MKIKIIIAIGTLAVLTGCSGGDQKIQQLNDETVKEALKKQPDSAYLKVPFITQAPLQTTENWKYHEASCEEAAVLQAYLFETSSAMSKEEADKEILKMTSWEIENFGDEHDIYADEVKKFIMGYYKISDEKVKIIRDASITDIKNSIINGHPVIVPITGNILKNPYYPYPGYHMLTVIGYTKDRIITNDNGTKHGENYSYDTATFEKARKDASGDIIIIELKNNAP